MKIASSVLAGVPMLILQYRSKFLLTRFFYANLPPLAIHENSTTKSAHRYHQPSRNCVGRIKLTEKKTKAVHYK